MRARSPVCGSPSSRDDTWSAASALSFVLLIAIVGAAGGCSGERNALLLRISAAHRVDTFDLRVKSLSSGVTNDYANQRITTDADPNRDISQPGQELKVALEFERSGRYLVHILGRGGSGGLELHVAIRDFAVSGLTRQEMRLVPLEHDEDHDLFPDCAAYPDCSALENTFSCKFLDCLDSNAKVNPMQVEGPSQCGNGLDDDCSAGCGAAVGEGDLPCQDEDGDGVPVPSDCDDKDPCRSPDIVEAPNLCGHDPGSSTAIPELPDACVAKLLAEGASVPEAPYCGDGIDQDCSGADVPCIVDADCDGYSAPADCDDNNAAVHPGAVESCDGVDNDCSGVADEGCVPCDVDGDQHASVDAPAGDPTCTVPHDDCDDYDAGVYPGVGAGANEGGTVLAALRGFCSSTLVNRAAVAQRDVDHDCDGVTAALSGCAPASCDEDGDGFAAATCDPPPLKSAEDCDDKDPHVFPGAPDVCGDGKAQNCISDSPCTDDKDHDGYLAPADCNDDDAAVHPWAQEVCNGIDDDCDQLIDEGNPDDTGALIATDQKTCSDNGNGQCSPCPGDAASCAAETRQLTGVCACSRQTPIRSPSYPVDSATRTACRGEDEGAAASQRCFGALQPQLERCDVLDWDCNGIADDPSGENFADAGKQCGTVVGNCVVGTVVGCDLSRELPNAAEVERVLSAAQPPIAFNRHWVCSPETQLPVPEVCNGKDDNCDGVKPDDELDTGDGDLYLPCSGCQKGTDRLSLASGLLGCDDCDPQMASVHPGAPETCDGVDENCDQLSDAGQTSICAAGETCCAVPIFDCVDLSNDVSNCGSCGRVCSDASVDSCSGGQCVCGNTGGPCPSGLDCVGGVCICKSGGRCPGCCDGNACITTLSASQCGKNGQACVQCTAAECYEAVCTATGSCATTALTGTTCSSDGSSCTQDLCNAGVCQHTSLVSNTCLINGVCYSSGAVNPAAPCQRCVPTTSQTSWTIAADACLISGSCYVAGFLDPSNSCRICDPTKSTTSWTNRAPTTTCTTLSGVSGACDGSNPPQCCTGCLSSTFTCLSGTSTTACGTGGVSCAACVASTNCESASCSTGECIITVDNSKCSIDGVCYKSGEVNSANPCEYCDPTKSTTSWTVHLGQSCKIGDVVAGVCAVDGTCCAGCLTPDNVCQPGLDNSFCGAGGISCVDCTAIGGVCLNYVCQTP